MMAPARLLVAALALAALAARVHSAPVADQPFPQDARDSFAWDASFGLPFPLLGVGATPRAVLELASFEQPPLELLLLLADDAAWALSFVPGDVLQPGSAAWNLTNATSSFAGLVPGPDVASAAFITKRAASDASTLVVFASASKLLALTCDMSPSAWSCLLDTELEWSPPALTTSVALSPYGAWLASGAGLALWAAPYDQAPVRVSSVSDSCAAASYAASTDTLSVGCASAFYWSVEPSAGAAAPFSYEWTQGNVDTAPTAIATDTAGATWVGNAACINQLAASGEWVRIDGLRGGLPQYNVTALASGAGVDGMATAVGTLMGLAVFHPSASEYAAATGRSWTYYNGNRWLPTSQSSAYSSVTAVAVASASGAVWAATDAGLSRIAWQRITLAQKAAFYQSTVPRFDRLGFVASCSLAAFGDEESCSLGPGESDGLWTGVYLGAQSFRVAVEGSAESVAAAWRAFEAMEFLYNVTGVQGLMARTYAPANESVDGSNWHASTAYPAWQWMGDTSSDDVCGHFFSVALFHDLVANSSADRARAAALVTDSVAYIVKNDFFLVDVTGRPTTWGVWNPQVLNLNSSYSDERGLNSLQMLSFLLAAYRLSGDDSFTAAYQNLVQQFGYDRNIVNQKITIPSDINFSDDENAFLPYFLFFNSFRTANVSVVNAVKSVTRAWQFIAPGRPAPWCFIYTTSPGADASCVSEAVQELRLWPLSAVQWPFANTQRRDLTISPYLDRGGKPIAEQWLPPNEATAYRWNANPFILDDGDGMSAVDPGTWMLPYWMGRFLGLIA